MAPLPETTDEFKQLVGQLENILRREMPTDAASLLELGFRREALEYVWERGDVMRGA